MSAAEKVAAPGLVGQVTSVGHSVRTFPSLSKRNVLRELNRQRRMRRMRRVVIGAADASRESAERGGYRSSAVLVTLTYAKNTWDSRHISAYIKRLREWLSNRNVRCMYQWVIELQQRGVPHYHIIVWLPPSLKLPKPDASGMWTHGSSNIKRATRPVGYLVKYATKGGIESGTLPKGARLFGVGAGGEASVSHARHRFGLPTWLHDSTEAWQVFRRVTRVGWVCRESGEVRSTPFTVSIDRDPFGGFITLTIITKGT